MRNALVDNANRWHAGGDVNTQIAAPRPGEEDRSQAIAGVLASRRMVAIDYTGPSHRPRGRSHGEASQIDMLAGPAEEANHWRVAPAWTGCSDHAALVATYTAGQGRSSRLMTPAALRSLPPEAFVDLRGRYSYLERQFEVPARDIALPEEAPYRAPTGPLEAPPDAEGTTYSCPWSERWRGCWAQTCGRRHRSSAATQPALVRS